MEAQIKAKSYPEESLKLLDKALEEEEKQIFNKKNNNNNNNNNNDNNKIPFEINDESKVVYYYIRGLVLKILGKKDESKLELLVIRKNSLYFFIFIIIIIFIFIIL